MERTQRKLPGREAVEWCRERGVEFWAVNKDYPEESLENNNHFSRKLKADWFIGDRGIGGLPDWGEIYQIITNHTSYRRVLKHKFSANSRKLLKRNIGGAADQIILQKIFL